MGMSVFSADGWELKLKERERMAWHVEALVTGVEGSSWTGQREARGRGRRRSVSEGQVPFGEALATSTRVSASSRLA